MMRRTRSSELSATSNSGPERAAVALLKARVGALAGPRHLPVAA